jgi:hypothetical protein
VKRLGERLDPELLAVGIDQADFTGSDSIVDPVLAVVGCSGYAASLLVLRPLTRKGQASESNARPRRSIDPGAPRGGRVGAEAPLPVFGFQT